MVPMVRRVCRETTPVVDVIGIDSCVCVCVCVCVCICVCVSLSPIETLLGQGACPFHAFIHTHTPVFQCHVYYNMCRVRVLPPSPCPPHPCPPPRTFSVPRSQKCSKHVPSSSTTGVTRTLAGRRCSRAHAPMRSYGKKPCSSHIHIHIHIQHSFTTFPMSIHTEYVYFTNLYRRCTARVLRVFYVCTACVLRVFCVCSARVLRVYTCTVVTWYEHQSEPPLVYLYLSPNKLARTIAVTPHHCLSPFTHTKWCSPHPSPSPRYVHWLFSATTASA